MCCDSRGWTWVGLRYEKRAEPVGRPRSRSRWCGGRWSRYWPRPALPSPVGSRQAALPPGLRRDIRYGDMHLRELQFILTAWDHHPRYVDHIQAHQDGGPANETNGQGPCEFCNHAKQAADWHSRIRPGRRHEMETTTPTGRTHLSRALATWPAAPPLATRGSTCVRRPRPVRRLSDAGVGGRG